MPKVEPRGRRFDGDGACGARLTVEHCDRSAEVLVELVEVASA